MQNKYLSPLVILAACILPHAQAHAESTADSLTRIEAETMVLKARERQLEVQASIVGKQNEIAAKQSMTAALTQTEVVGDPVIRAIEGIGSRLYATLQMSDGSIIDVQQGDTLPTGMKIVSIGSREVVAQGRHGRIRLASYAPINNGFNPYFPGPGLTMPGVQQGSPVRGAAR